MRLESILRNVLIADNESSIKNLLTETSSSDDWSMPLTRLAMQKEYGTLETVLKHIMDNCSPDVTINIVGAQHQMSRRNPSLDFEDPSDRESYVPDPSWTLYHFYAAAGSSIRARLEPLIEALPVVGNTTTSGLFRKDQHDRTPFELAMQNCDPASAVLLLEKMGAVAKELSPYAVRTPITDPLGRVSDDRLLLPRLYDMTEMGILSHEQFVRMTKALQDCVGPRMFRQLDSVVDTAVEYENLGFLRAVLKAFPSAIDGHVLMENSWERLAARAEAELESDREAGTMNVPLSALMLKECIGYMSDAYVKKLDIDGMQELHAKARENYPLAMQTVEALTSDNDVVAFYWPPDSVTERVREERMSRREGQELEDPDLENTEPGL